MKFISTRVLGLFGYRKVLIVNTVLIGLTICLYALVTAHTSLVAIIAIGLALGFFNSLQFSSMNSMAYADIETNESSMASTIASSFQQISMSFGLACGSLVTAWYLGDLPQSDRLAVITALHRAFVTLGGLTIVSSLSVSIHLGMRISSFASLWTCKLRHHGADAPSNEINYLK
jgi:MFS family permease